MRNRLRITQRMSNDLSKLDDFTRSYLETALWSSTVTTGERDDEPLDENHDLSDLAQSVVDEAITDCADFRSNSATQLAEAYEIRGYNERKAGHDFWLSRNGHGAGFFDEGNEECWDKLQDAARHYGAVDLYIGDDGQIYA